jgi:hypothetical protein
MGWAKASEIKTEGDSGPNKPSPVNNNNNKKKKNKWKHSAVGLLVKTFYCLCWSWF